MQVLFLQQLVPEHLIWALSWTLIHSFWQGLLAAALAGAIVAVTRRSIAGLRYNLLGTVLLLYLITTAFTFCLYLQGNSPVRTSYTNISVENATTPGIVTAPLATVARSSGITELLIRYCNEHADLLVSIWAVFFWVQCIKIMTGLTGIERLRGHRTHLPPHEWLEKLSDLCNSLGINRPVSLLQSELIKIPAAIGVFKPVILVPLGLLSNLTPEQVESILLHELAHIRRKDYFINILQRFAEAIFFFNPAMLWISSLVRQEREACCDDIVLAHARNKASYLEALVSFQEYSLGSAAYAMAISGNKHYLLNRVQRILTRKNKNLSHMEKIILTAGLTLLMAFTFIARDEKTKDGREVARRAETSAAKLPDHSGLKPLPGSQNEISRAMTNWPADTVPQSQKQNPANDLTGLHFKGVSTTIHEDGENRTQVLTATDDKGRKYSFTQLNDRITAISIDGKNIPENEFGDFMPLLEKIEITLESRRMIESKKEAMNKMEAEKNLDELKSGSIEEQRRLEQRELLEKYRENAEKYHDAQKEAVDLQKKYLEMKLEQDQMDHPGYDHKEYEKYRQYLELLKRGVEKGDKKKMLELEKLQKNMFHLDSAGREIIWNGPVVIPNKELQKADIAADLHFSHEQETRNSFPLELKNIFGLPGSADLKLKFDFQFNNMFRPVERPGVDLKSPVIEQKDIKIGPRKAKPAKQVLPHPSSGKTVPAKSAVIVA